MAEDAETATPTAEFPDETVSTMVAHSVGDRTAEAVVHMARSGWASEAPMGIVEHAVNQSGADLPRISVDLRPRKHHTWCPGLSSVSAVDHVTAHILIKGGGL